MPTQEKELTLEELDRLFDQGLFDENSDDEVKHEEDEGIKEEETEEEVIETKTEEDTDEDEVKTPEVTESKEEKPSQKQDSQANYAFAQLRNEKEQLARELESIATSLGFSGVEELREKVKEFRIQREIEDKKIPKEATQDYISLIEERTQIESEKAKLEEERRTLREREIEGIVADISEQYNIPFEKIGSKLIENGISYEQLLTSQNVRALVTGSLIEEITAFTEKDRPRKVVDTEKLEPRREQKSTIKDIDIDKLIDMDIAESMKGL